MKATGILKTGGRTLIINDYLPALELEEAKRLYKDGKLSIDGGSHSMRSRLTRILTDTEPVPGRLTHAGGMSHKELSEL